MMRKCGAGGWAGLALALLLMATTAAAHELPLGDGKLSTVPRAGYLMACMQHWGRGGAADGVPWIHGTQWDPAQKPSVAGNVAWPDHRLTIRVEGAWRIIEGNGLPGHPTGVYPIARTDPAFRYDRNPNSVRTQMVRLRLPADPQPAAQPSCVPMGMIGVATDGTAIYNAVDEGGRDAVAHEVQDACDGHPDRSGTYHFHGPSPCMPNERTSGLVGYALDGFGIYGMRDPATGRILHDADLDACHGTTGPVLWDGRMVTMYHYVLTEEYPYTIGCFRGTPQRRPHGRGRAMPAAAMNGGQGGPPQGPGGSTDPRQRLLNAAQTLNISPQTLREALGPPPPDLAAAAQRLGIPEERLRAALGAPGGMGQP